MLTFIKAHGVYIGFWVVMAVLGLVGRVLGGASRDCRRASES